jgi:hypothetical protein
MRFAVPIEPAIDMAIQLKQSAGLRDIAQKSRPPTFSLDRRRITDSAWIERKGAYYDTDGE